MSLVKISELAAASALAGTELIPVVQDGVTVRATAADIAALFGTGSALGWLNVKDYGAEGDGTTDDTDAIQDAIDAAAAAGGGVVYFPAGVYIVGGSLQDTSRSNCQIKLPEVAALSEQITIELRGPFAPPPIFSVVGTTPAPDNHSIIKGTLNSGAGGSMIGGWGPVGTFENFSNVHVVMRNLTARLPANPVLTAIDLSHVASCDVDGIIADVGNYDVSTFTQPTTTSSYGFKFPGNNNGATVKIGAVHAAGFYSGYRFSEHANGDSVNSWGCLRAFEFASASNHASVFKRLMAVHCKYGIVGAAAYHGIYVDQYNTEHAASGWMAAVYDLDDPNNYLVGRINWNTVLAGTGSAWVFLRNKGDYVEARRTNNGTNAVSYASAMNVNLDVYQVADITLTGNPTINLTSGAHGQKIMLRLKQDGTGSRTVTWGSAVRFGADIPSVTLSTTAGKTDVIGFVFDAVAGKYDLVAVAKGY